MTIQAVYEKYKHLDKTLSNHKWLSKTFRGDIIFDLWQVLKEEAVKTKLQEAQHETVP